MTSPPRSDCTIDAPLEIAARQKGLAFRSSVADDVPRTLVGDPVRLQQVLVQVGQVAGVRQVRRR